MKTLSGILTLDPVNEQGNWKTEEKENVDSVTGPVGSVRSQQAHGSYKTINKGNMTLAKNKKHKNTHKEINIKGDQTRR